MLKLCQSSIENEMKVTRPRKWNVRKWENHCRTKKEFQMGTTTEIKKGIKKAQKRRRKTNE